MSPRSKRGESSPESEPYWFRSVVDHTTTPLLGVMGPLPFEHLYHYTSAAGLHGILSTGVLRASNYSFMNDRTEFRHGCHVIKTVLRKQARRHDKGTLKQIIERGLKAIEEKVAASEVYVSCFSTAGDLLSQWRGYGGSYCIEFDPTQFREVWPRRFSMGKVIYAKDEQIAAAEHVVHKFIVEAPQRWDVHRDSSILADRLIGIAPLMKHRGFAEESEWRAVIFQLDEEIEFDSSSGVLKPFMKLISAGIFKSRRLPISRIIVSAPPQQPQAVKAARLLANKYGYSDVEVKPSKIPLSG